MKPPVDYVNFLKSGLHLGQRGECPVWGGQWWGWMKMSSFLGRCHTGVLFHFLEERTGKFVWMTNQFHRHWTPWGAVWVFWFLFLMGRTILGYIYFFFLWPHLRHMEVPGLRVKLELQLLAPTRATATPDLSRVCDLGYSLWPCWILNPLREARD